MNKLEELANKYYTALKDIISVLPRGAEVPDFLSHTSFIIICDDSTGKISLELVGRNNFDSIMLDNGEVRPKSEIEPSIIVSQHTPISDYIFPQDDKQSSISINVDQRYTVIEGLAFSNK